MPTLATVDVSKSTTGWTCEPLTVETVLKEGERLAYYVARTLRYLDELP